MQGILTGVPTANGPVDVPIPDAVSSFSMAAISAWLAATAAAYVQHKNAELQVSFDQLVNSYNAMMESGSYPVKIAVPVAPNSYLFVPATDTDMPTWNQDGPAITSTVAFDTVNHGLIPPPDKTPGQFAIGIPIPGTNGRVFQGLGDTNPEGTTKTILGPDGAMITVRKHNVPWGGYWEVVDSLGGAAKA